MHVDENLNNLKTGLYCVATPIGNLGDITLRALEILKNSDLILCEDTRVSKKLLNKFKISKKLISNHKFNENKNLNFIIEKLESNKIISMISDAGTPAISDPGKILINKCVEKNINIYSVPGPSAVSAAISVSGFSDKFLFCGFLLKNFLIYFTSLLTLQKIHLIFKNQLRVVLILKIILNNFLITKYTNPKYIPG